MQPARGAKNVGEHGAIIVIHHLAGGDREIEAAIRPDALKRETILIRAHGDGAGLAVLVVLVEQRDQPRGRQAAGLRRKILRNRLEGQDQTCDNHNGQRKGENQRCPAVQAQQQRLDGKKCHCDPHMMTRLGCSHGAPGSNDHLAMWTSVAAEQKSRRVAPPARSLPVRETLIWGSCLRCPARRNSCRRPARWKGDRRPCIPRSCRPAR